MKKIFKNSWWVVILLLVFLLHVYIWKLTWTELKDVYPIKELLLTNFNLSPGDNLNWETNILSSKLDKISIPMQIATDSSVLLEINQAGAPPVKANIKSQDALATILYEIKLPDEIIWNSNLPINLKLLNPSTNKYPVGATLLKSKNNLFRKFKSKLKINDQLIEENNLQLSLHYKDIEEPIYLRSHTWSGEILTVAWKRATMGKEFVNIILVLNLFIGIGLIYLGFEKKHIPIFVVLCACGLIFLMALIF